ncbi:Protein NETWORKED 2D [Abeliophyllum distichum]|uniref:Protein NETWORKED 2D n=1 Tax=Abeliophyllum distichum TaxID=126358 RepID=A0ABD1Q9N0_9LAMI
MEEKVEYILKIIQEDGDTFAQRAEMYYRKRPELVNFVEDSFRGYRALAERYDHMSRELQSANRTMATIYPERIQLEMDDDFDDDGDNFVAKGNLFNNASSKNLPAVPELSIQKSTFRTKNSKRPSRLMSNKGLIKINETDDANPRVFTPSSGLRKSEALGDIDKLQKEILALQTEKEFIKSSYESGLAKYWDIENQVNEMQAKVSNLQDEFGIGTVIEDDEARTLMIATALKSCQQTLARLQEKQHQSTEEVTEEHLKIEETRKKLDTLKEKFIGKQVLCKEDMASRPKLESENLDQQVNRIKEERCDMELLPAKIKEQLKVNSGTPPTMHELEDKVDDFVDKVLNLENVVSSQDAHVKRLKSEINELQGHIQSIEEETETLIEGSNGMSHKVRELEEELDKVQCLIQSIDDQNNHLQINFIEAGCSHEDISEKLLNVKPDEEVMSEYNVPGIFTDINMERNKKSDLSMQSENEEHKNFVKTTSRNHLSDFLSVIDQVRAVSNANREIEFSEEVTRTTPASSSVVLEDMEVLPEVKGDSFVDHRISNKAEANNSKSSDHYKHLDSQVSRDPSANSVYGAKTIYPACHSMIPKDIRIEGEEKRMAFQDDNHAFRGEDTDQVLLASDANSHHGFNEDITAPGHDLMTLKSMMMQEQEKNDHVLREERETNGDVLMNEPAKNGDALNYSALNFLVDERMIKDPKGSVADSSMIQCKKKDDRMASLPDSVITEDLKTQGKEDTIQSDIPKNIHDHSPKGQAKNFMDSITEISDEREERSFPMNKKYRKMIGGKKYEVSDDILIVSRDAELQGELKKDILPDEGKKQDPKKQDLFQTVQNDPNVKQNELGTQDDDEPNWKALFLNELDDREKILLQEYTTMLRNYKEVKKKLNEVEKKKRASLFQSAVQVKVLRNANTLKDEKIQSLLRKLNLLTNNDETQHSSACMIESDPQIEDHKAVLDNSDKPIFDGTETSTIAELEKASLEEEHEEDIIIISVDEPQNFSTLEEKIRMDIDDLLEENIEFWLRFSTSFYQIQKFQTSVDDLRAEVAKLKEKRQDGDAKKQLLHSDIRPIYRHLREIQTELTLWLEHNAMLKDDLQNRLSSLLNLLEEIEKMSNSGPRVIETELSNYQAAKFQGEILNMKQENNKVADQLQAGLERARKLQVQIQRTLSQLDEELGISANNIKPRNRSRIPLRSFLFGVKLKKQKPSFFSCVSPALQKQYSDVKELPT